MLKKELHLMLKKELHLIMTTMKVISFFVDLKSKIEKFGKQGFLIDL